MDPWPFPPPLSPPGLRSVRSLPEGREWRYEPKWDGFRALLWAGPSPRLDSRNRRDLSRAFPEVVAAATSLPPGTVVDGELVVVYGDPGDLLPSGSAYSTSFDALTLRLAASSAAPEAAAHSPATLVAFDLPALAGQDLRGLPLARRRKELEGLALPGPVRVTPSTTAPDVAEGWFEEFRRHGCEGLVVKRETGTYEPGRDAWLKVRGTDTAEVVVCGFRIDRRGELQTLLLGVHTADGRIAYVGEASIPDGDRVALLPALRALERPVELSPDLPGPWRQHRWEEYDGSRWATIAPTLVVEVAFDKLEPPGVFRHTARLLRLRPDKDPEECTRLRLLRGVHPAGTGGVLR